MKYFYFLLKNIFLFLIVNLIFSSCASYYVLSREDLNCIRSNPILLEVNNENKMVDFDSVNVYDKYGRQANIVDNLSLRNSFGDDTTGGILLEDINQGVGKGAKIGAITGAILCFSLALMPGLGSYNYIAINLIAAATCPLIGAGLGALMGGPAGRYSGPAKVVDCKHDHHLESSSPIIYPNDKKPENP